MISVGSIDSVCYHSVLLVLGGIARTLAKPKYFRKSTRGARNTITEQYDNKQCYRHKMKLVWCNRLAIGSTGSLHFPLINMPISKADSRFYKLEVERCLQTQSQGDMIQTSMT